MWCVDARGESAQTTQQIGSPGVLACIHALKTTSKVQEHQITKMEKGAERGKERPNPNQSKNIDSDLRGHDFFIAEDQPDLGLIEERLNIDKVSISRTVNLNNSKLGNQRLGKPRE